MANSFNKIITILSLLSFSHSLSKNILSISLSLSHFFNKINNITTILNLLFLSFFILKDLPSFSVFFFLIHSFYPRTLHSEKLCISRKHSIIQKLVFIQLFMRNCKVIISTYDWILTIVDNLILEFYRIFWLNLILIDYCKFKGNVDYYRQ